MRLRAISKETKGSTAVYNSHVGLFLAVKGSGWEEGGEIMNTAKSLWTNSLKNLPRTLIRGKYTEDDPKSETAASVLGRDPA